MSMTAVWRPRHHDGVASIEIRSSDPLCEPARSLIDASEAALAVLYGPPKSMLAREAFLAPGGGYVVALDDGRVVGGAGFTRHDESTAEIRRMYVMPEDRSRGLGRQLLAAIEAAAHQAGFVRVVLDTGPGQPHAEALYRSAGYVDIENYRGASSRGSYWGAKNLA
jgi:GNAT superfamily N-acetyltransferase